MGKFILFLFGGLVLTASATDVPLGTAFFTQSATLAIFASPNTNSMSSGLGVEANLYHTIQVTLSTNLTSSATFAIDGSLDNTNWSVASATNSIANTGGSTILTVTGKYSFVRLRNVIGTNAVGSALYLGGR